jgi:hypothetical protein
LLNKYLIKSLCFIIAEDGQVTLGIRKLLFWMTSTLKINQTIYWQWCWWPGKVFLSKSILRKPNPFWGWYLYWEYKLSYSQVRTEMQRCLAAIAEMHKLVSQLPLKGQESSLLKEEPCFYHLILCDDLSSLIFMRGSTNHFCFLLLKSFRYLVSLKATESS